MFRFFNVILFSCIVSISVIYGRSANDPCVTQTEIPPKNYFVIVIDRSGSMVGGPIQAAKQGAINFVNSLKDGDQCALITFSDHVKVLASMTDDKRSLIRKIDAISADGMTALYDAIAMSVSLLSRVDGTPIIVYMTDGIDTGSKFSLRDLEGMNIVEGILVYGLGYGSIAQDNLTALSRATGGDFVYAKTIPKLTDIYGEILKQYYRTKGRFLTERSKLTVRSIPDQLRVSIDGEESGLTPLNIENFEPGDHRVIIDYPKGRKWECSFDAKPSHRIVIDARESDLGYSLRIASSPKGASVFLDSVYVGMTSEAPMSMTKKKFLKKTTKNFSKELEIPYLVPGKHHLRLVAIPEFNFGGNQVFEFEFAMGVTDREVDVDIFSSRYAFTDGNNIQLEKKTVDPFQQLNSLPKKKKN